MNDSMAQVIIRNLETQTVERLKARARRRHHSLEAELRELLNESVAGDEGDFITWAREHRLPRIPGFDAASVVREGRAARLEALDDAVRRRR